MLINTTSELFSPEKAEKVAAELQLSDPDWVYKVIPDPKKTGFSLIAIYDKNGKFIPKF